MVNLEEILEKKPYTCPVMQIKFLDFSDIVTDSQSNQGGTGGAGENGDDIFATTGGGTIG